MIKTPGFLIALLILPSIVVSTSAQRTHKTRTMTGSAAKGAESAGMQVVPDLSERLSKFREVRMPFRSDGLSPREQKMIGKLVDASRYDLLDENKPFVRTTPMPPGRGFYPQGLTRDQVEKYVKDHPEKKDEIYSSTTVVRWHGDQLEGLPYHIAYRSFLEPAARDLKEAAELSSDPAFADFLRLRADACSRTITSRAMSPG